jgi:hypothetical protein
VKNLTVKLHICVLAWCYSLLVNWFVIKCRRLEEKVLNFKMFKIVITRPRCRNEM